MTLHPTKIWLVRIGLLLTGGFFTATMLLYLIVLRPPLNHTGHVVLGAETVLALAFILIGAAPVGFTPPAGQRKALEREIGLAAVAAVIVAGAMVRITMGALHG